MKKFIYTATAVLLLVMVFHNAPVSAQGCYYVSGKPADHGIWLSVSDSQGQWPRGNKVLINGVFDGDAVDPDIMHLEGGIYRLYYFKGYFVTQPPVNPGPNKIYSADSYDGINFTVNGPSFEYAGITDPSVVRLSNGDFLMACAKSNGGSGTDIVLARSVNGGLTFTYQQTLSSGGIPELYLADNGSVRIYYNGNGGIVSKISNDNGASWQAEAGIRLSMSGFVADPSIVKAGENRWLMFLKGFNNTGQQSPAGHKILLAESTDNAGTFTIINSSVLDSASVPDGIFFVQTTTASQLITGDARLKVFPNPASELIHIEISSALRGTPFSIADNTGRIVMSGIFKSERETLSMAGFPAGTYHLMADNGIRQSFSVTKR